jgi:hypothetical protein
MDIKFTINPYNQGVANKIIDGKQMTICWHVDDLKASHAKTKSMDRMIKYLRQEYKSIFKDGTAEMVVSQDKTHDYLVITLDCTIRVQAKITIFDYVDAILTAFAIVDLNGAGTKSSAAPDNLFTVNEDCEKLSSENVVQFHTLVAKTLYATK